MKTKTHTHMLIVLVTLASVAVVGCSGGTDAESEGFVTRVIDSVAVAVAENLTEDLLDAPTVEPAVVVEGPELQYSPVNDLMIDNSLLYAVREGVLTIYDFKTDGFVITEMCEQLRAIAKHSDQIYIGGDRLYTHDSTGLVPLDEQFDGQITALHSYGPSLMIGTTEGLYARNLLGNLMLLDGIAVSAIVMDNDGLWIGTDGQGLFRWDGKDFKKRYLARDSSLFDFVTAMDFNNNHLYLGTPGGMYVFDGGCWQTLTVDDGLPSDVILSIDASGWVVNIGTDAGLVGFFNNEFTPIDRLENRSVTAVKRIGQKIIAGTVDGDILLKSGPVLKSLISSPTTDNQNLASVAQ